MLTHSTRLNLNCTKNNTVIKMQHTSFSKKYLLVLFVREKKELNLNLFKHDYSIAMHHA
jgi:hypothetical protein